MNAENSFCPTELSRAFRVAYDRFSAEEAGKLRKMLLEKHGWNLFGSFTFIFLRFLDAMLELGHKRVTEHDLIILLGDLISNIRDSEGQPRIGAKELQLREINTPESIMEKISQLVQFEIEFYSQELLKDHVEHPDLATLRSTLETRNWEAVISWLFRAGERRQLEKLMALVPAFARGFWK